MVTVRQELATRASLAQGSPFERLAAHFLTQYQEFPLYSVHPSQLKFYGQRVRIYNEMSMDALLKSASRYIKFPILSAKFRVIPGDTDADSVDMACCVENGLGVGDESILDVSWLQHVEEMLTCVEFGFSIAEMVLGYMENGDIGFRQLNFIPAIYLDWYQPWVVQYGELIGMRQQMIYDGSLWSKGIPIERLLHFQFEYRNRQPDGLSAYGPVWIHWKNRKSIEEFEQIGIEHDTGGTPIIYPPKSIDKATAQWVLDQLVNVKLGGQIGIVAPGPKQGVKQDLDFGAFEQGWLIEPYTGNTGTSPAIRQVIRDYNREILMTIATQWAQLGQDSSGSFALAKTTMDFFLMLLTGLQQKMLTVWQRSAIERLYRWNLYQYPRAKRPVICWDPPALQDLQVIIEAFNSLAELEILKPTDLDAAYIRSIMNLPGMLAGAKELKLNLPIPGDANSSRGLYSTSSNNEPQGGRNAPPTA